MSKHVNVVSELLAPQGYRRTWDDHCLVKPQQKICGTFQPLNRMNSYPLPCSLCGAELNIVRPPFELR